jgi:hypothetical protein
MCPTVQHYLGYYQIHQGSRVTVVKETHFKEKKVKFWLTNSIFCSFIKLKPIKRKENVEIPNRSGTVVPHTI